MINLNLYIVTKNIFKLLDYSGITDLSFAHLLGISEKQLRLIRSGKANFNIDNINKACDFFCVSLSKINSEKMEIENNFREQLAHKHRKNLEYFSLIEGRPTIRHAIKFHLLHDSRFNKDGLVAGEIKKLFMEKGWDFSSRYISTSMSRNQDLIDLKGNKTIKGRNANIYGVKKM